MQDDRCGSAWLAVEAKEAGEATSANEMRLIGLGVLGIGHVPSVEVAGRESIAMSPSKTGVVTIGAADRLGAGDATGGGVEKSNEDPSDVSARRIS